MFALDGQEAGDLAHLVKDGQVGGVHLAAHVGPGHGQRTWLERHGVGQS